MANEELLIEELNYLWSVVRGKDAEIVLTRCVLGNLYLKSIGVEIDDIPEQIERKEILIGMGVLNRNDLENPVTSEVKVASLSFEEGYVFGSSMFPNLID